jgi:hypothetical protein
MSHDNVRSTTQRLGSTEKPRVWPGGLETTSMVSFE